MLAVPGKQPPLPSDPSGTFDEVEAQPGVPVGEAVTVAVGVGVGVGVGVLLGVGDALCVGVGLADGLDDGVAVTVTVTLAVAVAVTVTLAVTVTSAVAITVCVAVPFGGLGEMQTTMIRWSLWGRDFTGFAEHDAVLGLSVVAWTAPIARPTTTRTAVRAEMAARLGVMGLSPVIHTHPRRRSQPAYQVEGPPRPR